MPTANGAARERHRVMPPDGADLTGQFDRAPSARGLRPEPHGLDPVLGGTRLVFFFFSGDVSSFSAQVERGPFGSLPTSLITCALSAAFLLSSCGSLRADLGQSESGNSSLLPGTYRAGARSPNWPYRRFDRHRCPCPSKLRVALQYGREGSITEGGRTDRWPQITATPSGKFLQELMIVTNGNISM
jgi:hypothetical protein